MLFSALSDEALTQLSDVSDPEMSLRAYWEVHANRDSDGFSTKEAQQFLELVRLKYGIDSIPHCWGKVVLQSATVRRNDSGPIDISVTKRCGETATTGKVTHPQRFVVSVSNGVVKIMSASSGPSFEIQHDQLCGPDLAIDERKNRLAVVSYDFNFPGSGKLSLLSPNASLWHADVWGFPFGSPGNSKQVMDVIISDERVIVFGANAAFLFIEAFDHTGRCTGRFTSSELH